MGCGNPNGCLGPKPREREVYLDLIESIHLQAQKIQIPQSEDPYAYVGSRLTKKGLVKKLLDNLTSHKSNLYECSHQILQLTARSNNLSEHTASLIVVDKIVVDFFGEQPQSKLEIKHSKSKDKNSLNMEQILPTLIRGTLTTELPVDIEQRVNIIYFKIIIVLIEKEPFLYKDILSSLQNFLTLKTDKIICKAEVFKIFELLMSKLKTHSNIQKTNAIISLFLSRVKQNYCNELNKEHITFFIQKWFYKSDRDREDVTHSYSLVIQEFIERSFGNTDTIVLALIIVLDEISFETKGAGKIEELLVKNVGQGQKGRQIIKSLAIFLLKYLQIGEENNDIDHLKFKNAEQPSCKLNGFKLLTKWILQNFVNINSIIQYNPSAIISSYVHNIQNARSSGFQNELKTQYFKIISTVSNKSFLIITNLLAEELRQPDMPKQKREIIFALFQEIFRIKKEILQDEEYCTKIKFLINCEKYYPKELYQQILNFNNKNIKVLNILKIKSNQQSNNHFRKRICQFLQSIFSIVISYFQSFDSLSQHSINSNSEQAKKIKKISSLHKFLQDVNKFIKVMNQCHLQSYLLSFISTVNQYIEELDPSASQKQSLIFFFLTLLIETTLYTMNKKQKITQSVAKLSHKLEKEPHNVDLRLQILQVSSQLMKKEHKFNMKEELDSTTSPKKQESKLEIVMQQNDKKIDVTYQLFMIKELQKNEIMNVFKQLLGEHIRESKNKNEAQQLPEREFNRLNSVNLSVEEVSADKNSMRNQAEESFNQILERVREE